MKAWVRAFVYNGLETPKIPSRLAPKPGSSVVKCYGGRGNPFFKAERILEVFIDFLLLMTWDCSENALLTTITDLKYCKPPFDLFLLTFRP